MLAEPNQTDKRLETNLIYDAFGNVTSVESKDAQGTTRRQTLGYDPSGLTLRQRTNGAGLVSRYRIDSVDGSFEVTDPNGLRSGKVADAFGRVVKIFDPHSSTSIDYAAPTAAEARSRGRLRVTSTTLNGPKSISVTDAANRPVLTQNAGYSGALIQSEIDHDFAGRAVRATTPHLASQPASSARLATYDNLGRLYSQSWPEEGAPGGVATRTYRYASPAVANRTGWDEYAREKAVEVLSVSEAGTTTSTAIDSAGHTLVTRDALGNVTHNRYGAFGALTRVIDSDGHETIIGYDNLGRRTSLVDPDTGTESTTYTAFGEPLTVTDATGTQTLDYDGLGRLIERRIGTTKKTWRYDGLGARELGQLVEDKTEAGGVVTTRNNYAYVPAGLGVGKVASTTLSVNGQTFVTKATYRALGLVSTIEYPNGAGTFTVQHDYDAVSNLVGVKNTADATTYWQLKESDQGYRVGLEEFGDQSQTRWAYKPASGRVDVLTTTKLVGSTRTNIQRLGYSYTARGQVDLRTDYLQSARTRGYVYDDLQRIASVTDAGGAELEGYSYDAIGNLRHVTGIGDLNYGGSRPHAVTSAGATTYQYDARGNQSRRQGALVQGAEQRLSYTPFGKLATVRDGADVLRAQLTYDASETRVRFNQPGVADTYYVGQLYEERRAGTTTDYRYRIWAAGREVAQVSRRRTGSTLGAKSAKYLHADELGSVDTVSDTGTTTSHIQYSAFGSVTGTSLAAAGVSSGFTGHRHDDDLGLIDMKGRFFDRAIGRFISPDPYIAEASSGQALNRYSYVNNNPTNLVDPSGYQARAPQYVDDNGNLVGPDANGIITIYVRGQKRGEKPTAAESGGRGYGGWGVPAHPTQASPQQARNTPPASTPPIANNVPAYQRTFSWWITHTNNPWVSWVQNDRNLELAQTASLAVANAAATVALWELAIPRLLAAAGGGGAAAITTTTTTATTTTATARAAEGAAPIIEATELTGVQANKVIGDAAADELAESLRQAGLMLEREVPYRTAIGTRIADLRVSDPNGAVRGLVEVKVGNSPYTAAQRLKDFFIQSIYGHPTNVVRY